MNALACLVSAAAYDPDGYRPELAAHGLLSLRLIENTATDTQAILCEFPGRLVVGFRGTQSTNLRDLLTDFDTPLVPGPAGRVHSGFWIAWQSVKLDVLQAVSDAVNEGREVLLTGHSMGGALAAIALLDLLPGPDLSGQSVRAISFGAPRFCDDAAAAKLTGLTRVVLALDLVPRVPPPIPVWVFLLFELCLPACLRKFPPGYTHAGQLKLYSEGRPFSGGLLALTLERLRGYWQHFGKWGLASLEAHRVDQYLRLYEIKTGATD